jgi:hypothetical protein
METRRGIFVRSSRGAGWPARGFGIGTSDAKIYSIIASM